MQIGRNFELYCPTKVKFGTGVSSDVGSEVKVLKGGKVMVVADPGIVSAGLLEGILESLTTIEKDCYKALLDKGVKNIKRLFTIGGAVTNKKWMNYREKELGFTTANALSTEACFGTALLAQQGYNQQQSTMEQ